MLQSVTEVEKLALRHLMALPRDRRQAAQQSMLSRIQAATAAVIGIVSLVAIVAVRQNGAGGSTTIRRVGAKVSDTIAETDSALLVSFFCITVILVRACWRSRQSNMGLDRIVQQASVLPEPRQALQLAVLSRITDALGFVPMVVVSTCMTLAGSALFVIGDSRADSQRRLLDGSDPTNDTLGYTPTDARNNHAHVLFTAGS